MSLKSFYWKTRTLLSGDYREIERNTIAMHNRSVVKKYRGKKDIYCIMRIHTDEGGLFCLFFKVMAGLHYAITNDMIPVVDMQTKYNIFQTKAERGKLNTWELYFKQPAGVSFEEVKKLQNKVIIENPTGPSITSYNIDNDNAKTYWREIVRRYIKLNDKMEALASSYQEKIFDGSKVLGIMLRGTDYNKNTAVGHPIQPSLSEVIEDAHKAIDTYGFNKIFLATEDQKLFDAITAEFGDMVTSIPQKRFDEEITDKLGHRKDYASFAKEMNASYLASILTLSKCHGFLGGETGGSFGVWLFADEFEYFNVYNKGSFGMYDQDTCDMDRMDKWEKKFGL